MSKNFLLVEAVNIYKAVYDTDQLSVIRGTSFLLKNAITSVRDEFSKSLTALSTGASSGLFEVNATYSAADITEQMVNYLQQHRSYRLLPILVEHCTATDLLRAKEQLLTQLRFAQMRSVTIVPDYDTGRQTAGAAVCELEGVRALCQRPEQRMTQGKPRKLSDSVSIRLDYGRETRNSYYATELNQTANPYQFTADLETLANASDSLRLNRKVAVVYMDGNRFGEIQRQLIECEPGADAQIKAQREFDHQLQTLRKTLLQSLLDEIHAAERFRHMLTETGEIRFETLLWGGDEMLFVMPAWVGFEFIQFVFQHTANWAIAGQPLTHAAGLVFCHSKTPIRIIRDLAQTMLADRIKDAKQAGISGRTVNAFDYLVLESIDYPANQDFTDFSETHYGIAAQYRPDWLPACSQWDQLRPQLNPLIHEGLLAKRQVYRIAQALLTVDVRQPEGQQQFEQLEQRLMAVATDTNTLEQALTSIYTLLGLNKTRVTERAWMWLHLLELWDYLLPFDETLQAQACA